LCHGNDFSNFSLSSFAYDSDYFVPFLTCYELKAVIGAEPRYRETRV
jgi:hypothetical protein